MNFKQWLVGKACSAAWLAAAAIALLQCKTENKGDSPDQPLPTGSIAAAGLDSLLLVDLTRELTTKEYNIHSLLIIRHNRLVYEKYFQGKDEILGRPIGEIAFDVNTLHDCRSITKSVVSACVGIAIAQHRIGSVEDPVFDYFPEYRAYGSGIRGALTLKHLLTMTAGLEWNERIPYSDTTNSEIRMFHRKDVVEYFLSRPSSGEPGKEWNYSAGCTQLLAEIIEKKTQQKIDTFANDHIFKPLGIRYFEWYERDDATPWAPSGLRLRPRDMAKFGLLYLNAGRWNGEQIIPADWINASMQKQVAIGSGSQGYGYQFWVASDTINAQPVDVAIAIGFGGQRIYLVPALDMEIVVTAGNYNFESSDLPDEIVTRFIIPAIRKEPN